MYNKNKAYSFFQKTFKLKRSTHGWYRFANPFDLKHKDTSCAVHFDYSMVKDFRTGEAWRLREFIGLYKRLDIKGVNTLIEGYAENFKLPASERPAGSSTVDLPSGFKSVFVESRIGKIAIDYLTKRRRFSLEEIELAGIGYCLDPDDDMFGRLILPYRGREGELVFYTGRALLPIEPKYKNPKGIQKSKILYNEMALYLHKRVYITEGYFDALTMKGQGIALSGWAMSSYQKTAILRSPVKELIFCPDDEYFHESMRLASQFVVDKKVKVLNPTKLGEGKDVNDWGYEKIKSAADDAPHVEYSDIILTLLNN